MLLLGFKSFLALNTTLERVGSRLCKVLQNPHSENTLWKMNLQEGQTVHLRKCMNEMGIMQHLNFCCLEKGVIRIKTKYPDSTGRTFAFLFF